MSEHVGHDKTGYEVDENFILFDELASIMQKAGPGIDDVLFKHLGNLGDIHYACVTGYFTGASGSPTDLFIIGNVDESKLAAFIKRIEEQVNQEISYTPMTLNEYRYRINFSDMFLRQIFSRSYKELINKLPNDLQPSEALTQKSTGVVQEANG